MKCPGCGLYHPAFYERCVACGASLQTPSTDIEQQRQTRQNQAAPQQAVPQQGVPNQTMPNQASLGQVVPQQAMPNQAVPNQARPNQAAPQQAMPNPIFTTEPMPSQPIPGQPGPNQSVFNQVMSNQRSSAQASSGTANEVKRSQNRLRYGYAEDVETKESGARERKQNKSANSKQIPTQLGIFIALTILFVCAGITIFILSKSPDDKRLIDLGKHQLSLGQYAFAVQTLTKAAAARPNDPQAYLALARAYVGVDQVDQAWDCITHAQQLGVGVVSEPALASELANYYRQRGQYEKAVDLLRPLANAAIPGKKAELADLNALRGDECIEKGDFEQAQRCWEEVQQLHDGSRFSESDGRLSTIYTKLANLAYSNKDDEKALDYLAKLNVIGENSRNYLLAADIYERDGKLNEAIEQVRKALKLSTDNKYAQDRLAQLLSARGKELIGSGDSQSGYEYLQQAQLAQPSMKMPSVALKNTTCLIDPDSKKPKLTGQIWNPGNKSVEALTIRAELYDTSTDKVLWDKDERLIDEFVSPLAPQETKPFTFIAPITVKNDGNLAFRIYLDGSVYQSYPFKSNGKPSIAKSTSTTDNQLEPKNETEKNGQTKPMTVDQNSLLNTKPNSLAEPLEQKEHKTNTKATKKKTEGEIEEFKSPAPSAEPNLEPHAEPKEYISPEEKTIKDLEY